MLIYSRKMKMKTTSSSNNNKKKNLDVFDFKPDDDDDVTTPNPPIHNFTLAATGKSIPADESNYVPSLDIDTINMNYITTTLVQSPSAEMMADSNDALTVVKQQPQSSTEFRIDVSESEVNVTATSASPSNSKLKSDDLSPSYHERDEIGGVESNENGSTLVQNSSAESNDALTVVKQQAQSTTEPRTDVSESEDNVAATSTSFRDIYLKSAILDLPSSYHEPGETGGMDIQENGSMSERSSSSDIAEDDGGVAGPSSDHCIDGWDMDSEDMTTVALFPDYVIYRGSYYTDSLISFTESYIEMEGSEVDTDEKGFKCKWGIEDILHITSHWYEQIETATVKIHVLAKGTDNGEIVECASGTELKFSIVDSSWYERLEAILSLNIMYKALWTSMLESEDTMVRHPGKSSSNYLPIFVRPFEEVVYPKGDADAVSISKRDFDLLQPDTFVNDTIIDFYVKYLKNKIKPDEKRKLHFFNSFFFRKLADPDKDPIDASKGAAAYQRVKKWTRKVNLFEKDYVFIPVNYNYHWSLIVMCHLGEVATYEDEDVDKLVKVPCVLHMDSLRGSHTGLQGFVQSYLKEEWKARQHVDSEDISSRFDNLRFISLELPQQQNLFDCGLFLLHYVELFLEQAPVQFNPFKVSESFNFLNVDWFVPAEASLKRVLIQKLICDLLENPNQEPCSTADEDQQCHICSMTTNAPKGTIVNLSPIQRQKIEIPSLSVPSGDDPNTTLKPSFKLFSCPTIEEDVEQEDEIMPDDCRTLVRETVNDNHESLIVNEIGQLDSEIGQPTLDGYVDEMVDDTSCVDIIMPGSSFRFSDMEINGSENFSGLESGVQHSTKRMRMTQLRKVSLI